MKLITYLLIGMLLLTSVTFVYAANKNFDIIVIQGASLKAGTEKNLVTVTINNETSLEFQTVKVYLDLSSPFSASNKESDQFVIGNLTTIPKGAFFVIDVDSGANYGNYKIPVIIETNRGKYYEEIQIKVIGDTLVSVEDFSIDGVKGKTVDPGTIFNINLRMKNVGGNRLQWIKVELNTNEPGIVPVASSLSKTFQDLRPGEYVVASYDLSIGKDVVPKNHLMNLVLTFQDNLGVTHVQNEVLGLKIRGQPQLELTRRTTDPTRIVQNQPYVLTLKIENIGTTDADNVKVKIESPFTGDSESYLGKIQKNDYANAVFALNSGNNSGEIKCKLIITFFDDKGSNTTEKEFYISVNALPQASGAQVAANLILPIIILALIIGGVLYFRKKRKSKKEENSQ
ncbi:MAG: hypothetical protein APG12_00599 [Candidatus Methanofastidiosum methylothiophilum]|uniref:CARDB domain-containing protein n=1 Tax=Candidatus Methanofastidiosum methylothiophilum TaxID=1705564 RepID=A0A150J0B9_9EURY|nr:MAG: hypothetical protein APG10_00548 [Candidatus Methanofastidiosum methylthiophilus]KYC47997.1 MAG: hypothetical protein APG11_00667 [Candidatus Methanofastidiosum methylthiophilus]KYC50687.1 MAG: hypothetical protein APG12_00599 [Candidatus Methanofastidiosum methylthiophilus]